MKTVWVILRFNEESCTFLISPIYATQESAEADVKKRLAECKNADPKERYCCKPEYEI